MHTTRSPAEITSAADIFTLYIFTLSDRTTWSCDQPQPTGLLTNKLYADGKGTAYTYTPDGKLATRAWARGVTTTYAYDAAGSLATIAYSDDTPDVAFTYDRLGRMASATVAGVSTNLFAYDALDLVAETRNGVLITRSTDALGRPSGFSLGPDYAVQYAYDAYGRFHSLTSASSATSAVTFTYSYLPDSDLISGMTASSGFLWTRAYESARSLITSVENRLGETVISRYDYTNDELGRRTRRADSGLAFANPAFDAYSYNGRSEVTGAQRYHGTDVSDTSTVYGGRQFGYAYDPIGNRISASATIGGGTLAKAYTANALNQYTAIANPGAVGLRGDATNTAAVTVNGLPVQSDTVSSDTIPWHFALEADNANGPDFPLAEIVAVVNPPGTNTPDIVSTASGHLYAPPLSETLTYDADGNLTSDGRWQYAWNGENRLIKAEELVSPANRHPYVVEYAYDHRGRMVWKTVAATNAPPSKAIRYHWDDYNIIVETVVSETGTNTAYNVWGLDLSSSLQAAGGVGGLLAVVKDGEAYTAAFDANGNVTEYLSAEGAVVAHREYDPFGGTVACTSAATNQQTEISFTHWFSTKPWCPVIGLSEYEMRKYSPTMGRWLNKDPIGENGGIGLYAFCVNGGLSSVDANGHSPMFCSTAVSHFKKGYFAWDDPAWANFKNRAKKMQQMGCDLSIDCGKCDAGGTTQSTAPRKISITVCHKFCERREWGDWLNVLRHEFSHAYDHCMNSGEFPCRTGDGQINPRKICTEIRAYINGSIPPPPSKETVLSSACDSYVLACHDPYQLDKPDLKTACMSAAKNIYDTCSLLDELAPIPVILPLVPAP